MPKTKTTAKTPKPPKVSTRTNDVVRFMARLMQRSRDVNHPDKLALAELVKNLKD